ncbi:tripartite tricarboxylate transporter substrate binding protein [Variovorax guangxiensis]|uniref:Bug family tripartite tricarboxylate transporter substrate binding protein n=1 Tax=Variovorax guangxiensis TaxID=1775474 RepID=UPI00285FBDC3|nr:tripartite tricarboxylate transporter substrate binding protein [Variovorax guangxiensis]MDR6857536.1 tripartite-type tricarboxylate transporter receptor subunit TctC [Variovorax guangxiensis]
MMARLNGKPAMSAAVVFAVGSFLSQPASAQDWPTRPIRMIVPAAAGGSTDIGARQVAKVMAAELGQPVVVDNKGGAGGRLGAQEAARATPDGYTLIYGNSITHALLPATSKSVNYDPLKSFAAAGNVFWYSTLLVCNPKLPFADVAGYVGYAKANPGKLNIATAGLGSGNHFSSELLSQMAGIKVTHVPYKGNAPAVQDVMGGAADCIQLSEAKSYLDGGRLKALGTTGKARDPRFPNVRTVEEQGLKGFDATWWQGVFAPAGTPSTVMAKLAAAVRKAAEDPSTKAVVFDSGFVPEYVPPAQVEKRIQADMAKFRKLATDTGIELE